jgi:hypothetical protein
MYDSLFIDLEPRMDTDELECLAAVGLDADDFEQT